MTPATAAPSFPRLVSLTLTNACSLRCGICGQWGQAGYVPRQGAARRPGLALGDWLRLIAEAAREGATQVLIRGGEPFLHPGILPVLEAVRGAGLGLAIDTAGVELEQHAAAIARIGGLHLTVSVDGPPEVHDRARGVPGTFERMERGVRALRAAVEAAGTRVSLSLCCTIGPDTYRTLGELPDVARRLGIATVTVVPYCHLAPAVVRAHRQALEALGEECPVAPGFERSAPGVEVGPLAEQLRLLRERLGEVQEYPYMPLRPDEYATWFSHPSAPVGAARCWMAERVLDVQPDGDVDFCVDLADYRLGNARDHTLAELWRGARAERFRARVRQELLPGCARCVARYMAGQA